MTPAHDVRSLRNLVVLVAVVSALAASGCGLILGFEEHEPFPGAGASSVCGDGIKTGSEGCDDGNTKALDGCNASCAIENGYSCTGEPSVCTITKCGDGFVLGTEGCDDGNDLTGDGCTGCETEKGWGCSGNPSKCGATKCGDGIVAGAEECDDGNTSALDGCDPGCKVEPATCGDGMKTGSEGCDDGNTSALDGCDASCAVEKGYSCTGQPSVCTAICGDGFVVGTEGCDDGNTSALDGCDASCAVETGYTCGGQPSNCVMGWSCSGTSNSDDVCDCGCGIPDPACMGDTTAGACQNCNAPGSCSAAAVAGCPGIIDPNNNATCDVVKAGWTCNPQFYDEPGDFFCDCGCGIADPDCTDATVGACKVCNDSGSCSAKVAGCPGIIDPDNNATCAWTCNASFYGAADGCDCGCGLIDPDCPNAKVESCSFCNLMGSCGSSVCPGNIHPTQNDTCL